MSLTSKRIYGGLRVLTQGVILGNIQAEGSVSASLNVTVGQNLYVSGTSNLTGLLTAGDALISALTVSTGIIVSAGGVTITAGGLTVTAGGINVTDNSSVVGDVDITGSLDVTDVGILFKVNSLGIQSDGDYVVLTNLLTDNTISGKALMIDDATHQVKRFNNIHATAGVVYITGTLNVNALDSSGTVTGAILSSDTHILAGTYVQTDGGTYNTTGTKTLFTAGIGECWLISAWQTGNLDAIASSDRVIAFIQTGFSLPITPDCIVAITDVGTPVGLSISSTGATDTTIDITLVGIADTIEVSWTALRLL